MYIKRLGFFILAIFIFVGCVQNSEKKIDQKKIEETKKKEKPSYDKYQEGLENLRIN